MSDYRWQDDDDRRDERRSWTDRTGDEVRSWFGDDEARMRRRHDERQDRFAYGGDRSSRDRAEGRYERTSGSSGWRGARDLGGYEGARGGSGTERSRDDDWRGYGDSGHGDYGRGEYARGEYGRTVGSGSYGPEERSRYGRGAQHSGASYGQEEPRRSYGNWGSPAGGRDWSNRGEQWQWGGRTGSPSWGEPSHGEAGAWRRESQSYAGRGPKGYRRSDERIREEVSDLLTADPQVDASEIMVQVENGEVTLSGSVATREQKRLAEDCVEHISGVSDVTNNLRVNKQEDRHDVSRVVTPSVTEPGR